VTPSSPASPRCIIIAGPNGAGKTTFAQEFLPHDAGIIHFPTAGGRAMKSRKPAPKPSAFAAMVGRALRRSAKKARQVARMHGTLVYAWKDGIIVGEKP